MLLLLALTVLILAEIALFVTIGAWIGLGLTLLVVLGTAVAGALILRGAGLGMVDRLMAAVTERQSPLHQAGDRLLLALAGLLLILPGFLTDLVGLLLLLPPARQALLSRVAVAAGQTGAGMAVDMTLSPQPGRDPGRDGPSPWSGADDAVDAEVIGETPAPRSSPG